jgi:hypothetical protein
LCDRNYLNEQFRPQYDHLADELDTFRGKSGDSEYKYLIYYPPSPGSPLRWIGHAIYSFLLSFTGDRLCDRYVGQVLTLNEETVSKYLRIMEDEMMVSLEKHGRFYSVGLYDLGERQLPFFADAGSKSTSKSKGVVYLGAPPKRTNGQPNEIEVTNEDRRRVDRLVIDADNRMAGNGLNMSQREEVMAAFRPLAEEGREFEEVAGGCFVFSKFGGERYKDALLKSIASYAGRRVPENGHEIRQRKEAIAPQPQTAPQPQIEMDEEETLFDGEGEFVTELLDE